MPPIPDAGTPSPDAGAVAPVDAGPSEPALLFVAVGGDDKGPGTAEHPLASIGEALVRAALTSGVPEVRVCTGTYLEAPITITKDVRLLGSYACPSWNRELNFSHPSYGLWPATEISCNQPSDQAAATLTLLGTGVTSNTIVEGVSVFAPENGGARSTGRGILVADGASA